jgi:hypothetical protein
MKRIWLIALFLLTALYVAAATVAWLSASEMFQVAGVSYAQALTNVGREQGVPDLNVVASETEFAKFAILAFMASAALVVFLTASTVVVSRRRRAG